jgi:hypothetical protein
LASGAGWKALGAARQRGQEDMRQKMYFQIFYAEKTRLKHFFDT